MHQETPSDARPAGSVQIIEPQSAHTHTAIVLHGRGSNGPEFADELFATHLSDNSSLATKFPGWRWVFPSSKELWSTTFQEHMPAWFEAQSLTDTTLRQDLQIPGIMDSSAYLQALIEEEVEILDGKTSNLLFGGISQGGAVAMWMLLCRGTESRIGAFFAASTWLPFANNIEKVLAAQRNEESGGTAGQDASSMEYDSFIRQAMQDPKTKQPRNPKRSQTKVFLGHGLDDAYIDVELGRQARRVLSGAGFDVEWKEYSGAEEEGHWLQEPHEMDDIYQYMLRFSA
ncbi:hypothetical protein MY11210_004567 [Beauveria gryllotalpidicola]